MCFSLSLNHINHQKCLYRWIILTIRNGIKWEFDTRIKHPMKDVKYLLFSQLMS